MKLDTRCRKIVEGLNLPADFSAETFCEHLAAQRGRPIVLLPLPVPTSPELPTGMWYASPTTDYIMFDSQTSAYHREQIILHEAAHILWGHHGPELEDNAIMYRDPTGLPRARYSTQQEQEAETLASMLLLNGRRGRANGGTSDALSDAIGSDPWC